MVEQRDGPCRDVLRLPLLGARRSRSRILSLFVSPCTERRVSSWSAMGRASRKIERVASFSVALKYRDASNGRHPDDLVEKARPSSLRCKMTICKHVPVGMQRCNRPAENARRTMYQEMGKHESHREENRRVGKGEMNMGDGGTTSPGNE